VNGDPLGYIDPDGRYGIPGAIYGGVSGAVGGYISSGGSWEGTALGGAAGAVVGFFNPWASHPAGAAAGAAAASLAGQAGGNWFDGKDPTDLCNYDFGAVAGAALSGAYAAPLTGIVGRWVRPYRHPIIGRPFSHGSGVSNVPGQTSGAIVEGVLVGSGEFLGSNKK